MSSRRRAFTLIELLIVVAIIAILAAIAVPNFLEAQMRSKIGRCKADMRTYATALESYAIDNNNVYMTMCAPNAARQPFGDGRLDGASVLVTGTAGISARMIRLTTPIAYMSSVLRDPFISDSNKFALDASTLKPMPKFDSYDYVDARSMTAKGPLGGTRGAAGCSGAMWHMVGCGPDRINAYGGGVNNYAVALRRMGVDYDPSNGTTSVGDIVRIGGGPGPLVPGKELPTIDRIRNIYYAVPQ